MCVIVYQPKGTTLTRATLKNCFDSNPDGAGYMFSRNLKLVIRKGFFSFRKLWQAYRSDLVKNKDSAFVIHCRIATHGKVDKSNCHPFQVGRVGIAHNGVLRDMPPDAERSDTAIFCASVLSKLPSGWVYSKAQRVLLNAYAKANSSKLAFMDEKGNVWIANEEAGEWVDGIWYSNSSYKKTLWHGLCAKNTSPLVEDELEESDLTEEWVECQFCGGYYPKSSTTSHGDKAYTCEDCMAVIRREGVGDSLFLPPVNDGE